MKKYIFIIILFTSFKISFSQGFIVKTSVPDIDSNYISGSVLGGSYRIIVKFAKPGSGGGGYLFGGIQWSKSNNFPIPTFPSTDSNSVSGDFTFVPKFNL